MPLFINSLLTSKTSASPQPTAVSSHGVSPENSFKASYFHRSQQAIPRGRVKARCFADTARVASEDGLSKPEAALAIQIQQYRQANGLPAIRLSKALTLVANRHVQDLSQNGSPYAIHSWSNAPFDASNPATYPSMWEAPQRLKTGYSGNGYEIAFWTSTNNAKPAQALAGWKSSPKHDVVILNREVWQQPWKAMGVGIRAGYAVVWFGNQRDPLRVTRRDRSGQPSPS